MSIMREGSTTLRTIVIELFVVNYRFFLPEHILEFLPLLFKEVNKCSEFTDNWILNNFGLVVKLISSFKVLNKDYCELLHLFLHVCYILYTRKL